MAVRTRDSLEDRSHLRHALGDGTASELSGHAGPLADLTAVQPLVLRAQDAVLSVFAALACAALLCGGRRVDGWGHAALVFAGVAALPFVFRGIGRRWPSTFTRFMATFVPPSLGVFFIYANLNPLADLLNPHLADARLAAIDLRIFGVHPGFWMEQRLSGAAIDAFYLCYTSFMMWPVLIGLILYFSPRPRLPELDRFILGYLLVMLGSYVGYMVVPAIGPRFYLADLYGGPIRATALGTWLAALFRGSPYFRDCFPSGHTALTLYCLIEAKRLTPRFFKAMLLPALGLIAATLICRFHYAIDVICGPLLTLLAIEAADILHRRLPGIELGWSHVGEAWRAGR